MAVNLVPQKAFVLNYPLDLIKHSIEETLRLENFTLKEKNDLLDTYKIAIVIGLYAGIMDVSLSPVNEKKTWCTFQTFNPTGGISSAASLSGLQDKFFEIFTNILTGKIKIVDAPADNTIYKLPPAAWFLILSFITLGFVILIAMFN